MNEEPDVGRQASKGAAWFVELENGCASGATEAAFAAWLDADPRHADEYARCQAAAQLANSLKNDEQVAWAFADAARIAGPGTAPAATGSLRPGIRGRLERRIRGPALPWGVAGVCAVIAIYEIAGRPSVPPDIPDPVASTGKQRPLTVDLSTSDPVALLPGGVAVDARSIAILPFKVDEGPRTGPDAHSAASRFHEEIVRQLATTPGLYVISGEAVEPYEQSDIPARDMAVQLGVRGILQGRINAAEGQLQVTLSFTDAAKEGMPVQNDFQRPIAELADLRHDVVYRIVLALASSSSASNET